MKREEVLITGGYRKIVYNSFILLIKKEVL